MRDTKRGRSSSYTPTSQGIAITQMSHQNNSYANQWGWMYDPALGFAFAIHRSLPLEVLELATGRFYHRQALINRYQQGQLPIGGLQRPTHNLPQYLPRFQEDGSFISTQPHSASPSPAVGPPTNQVASQIVQQQSLQGSARPNTASELTEKGEIAQQGTEASGAC